MTKGGLLVGFLLLWWAFNLPLTERNKEAQLLVLLINTVYVSAR